jgi:hypothetical protein
MRIDHGFAAVQFVEDRLEGGIAQIAIAIARQQPDAIGFQGVESVLDFFEAVVDGGHRQKREQAEATLVIRSHLCAVLVHLAREAAGFVAVAEPRAGGGGRYDGCGETLFIHGLDVAGG